MGIELIDDEDPLAVQIGGHRLQDMLGKVFFGAGGSDGGGQQLSGGHVEVGDQGLGAMADVFELLSLYLSRFHRLGGVSPL